MSKHEFRELLTLIRIQPLVTSSRLIPRFLLPALLLCFFASAVASATPIQPDIRKMLQQQSAETPQFVPARAGWHGPEATAADKVGTSPTLEKFSPASTARALRAILVAAALPDWRILMAIFVLIVMLRRLRPRASKPIESASEYKEEAAQMRPAA